MTGRFAKHAALYRAFIKTCAVLAGTAMANAEPVQEESSPTVEGLWIIRF
jgi:hypothetical protein